MCDRRSRFCRPFAACRLDSRLRRRSKHALCRGEAQASGMPFPAANGTVSISIRLGVCAPIPWSQTPFCIVHEGVKSPPTGEIRRMHARQDLALRKALSAEIKARRAKLGLNQEDLAHAAGIGRASLARLESGVASPKLGSLFRLAAGLETDPGDFVGSIAKRYRKEARSL